MVRITFEVADDTPLSFLAPLLAGTVSNLSINFVEKVPHTKNKPAAEAEAHAPKPKAKAKRRKHGMKAHSFAALIRSHFGPAGAGKEFSVKELHARYPEVPQGTIYRALGDLIREGWCERASLGRYRKAPLSEALSEGQANGHA